MAGGKETPRQKMISLMYLVFISMLALSMSKEVLSAFGHMNEQLEETNKIALENSKQMVAAINAKGTENPAQFGKAKEIANKVEIISKEFYDFIGTMKKDATEGVELKEDGKLPYESMDKGPHIDEGWFAGDGYAPKGIEIEKRFIKYQADMKAAIGGDSKFKSIIGEVEKKFSTADIVDGEGIKKKFLHYRFEHFPAIASLTVMSALQSDVKKIENDVYQSLLGKAAVAAASFSNYQAMVVLDKNAYFQGEQVTGKVVLGRYDPNTKPTSFQGPGRLENGQAVISLTAGAVGEQDIRGQFTFLEDGKNIPLKFEGKYVVVPRPNSATISADKMNVVYRGVENPMTISFAGVSDSDVTASGVGLRKAGSAGKYIMSPGSGSEALINVTAKLPDGKVVSDKKVYRIKNIPAPQGAIGGQIGVVKGAKSRLQVSQVAALLQDFDFALNLKVVQFSLKVAGQPTVVVNGDRVNSQCASALNKAARGDQVTISDIKTKLEGSSLILKQTAPVIYEIQ